MSQEYSTSALSSSSTSSNSSLPTSTTTVPTSLPLPPKAEEKPLGTAISLADLPPDRRALAEALFTAAKKADVKAVEDLIAQKAPLNVKDDDGYTPLLRAADAAYGNASQGKECCLIVAALLQSEEGRDAACQANLKGTTPLIAAIDAGITNAVIALLATPQGRATIERADEYGSPLSRACGYCHHAIAPLLCTPEGRAAARSEIIEGGTPLLRVMRGERFGTVAALLATSEVCDTVNQANSLGETPLARVFSKGSIAKNGIGIGVMLLLQGANLKEAENWAKNWLATQNLSDYRVGFFFHRLELIKNEFEAFANGQEQNLENWLTYKAQKELQELPKIRKSVIEEGITFIVEEPDRMYAEALTNLKLIKESYQYEKTINGPSKSFEHWLIYKVQQELEQNKLKLQKAKQKIGSFVAPLTRIPKPGDLKLINKNYQAKLAAGKAETKQEVGDGAPATDQLSFSNNTPGFSSSNNSIPSSLDIPPETKESKHTSIQTTQSSQSIAQIQQIQHDLAAGNAETLSHQLQQPAEAGSKMHDYLQQEALTDILYAQADPKAESKDSQQAKAKLVAVMETLLQKDPAAVIRPNKEEDGLTPLDIALQLDLPKEVVGKLQQVAQVEYDRQNTEVLKKVAKMAQEAEAKSQELTAVSKNKEAKEAKAEAEAYADVASLLSSSLVKLKEMRDQLGQRQSTSSSVPLTPASTPLTHTAAPMANMVVGLSVAQKAQIGLGRQLLNIKLTKVFTEALAIKYELVDGFNQNRVGTAAGGGLKLVADLLPIPLAGTMAKAIVAGAKKAVEKRDRQKQEHRLGEISTIDQAAEHIAALVKNLTRRFQLVFAQLSPDSLEIFVDRIVDRMNDYWDRLPKKSGLDPQALGQLFREGLVDGTKKPLPKPSGQTLSQHQQFENLMGNMLLGVSLRKDREVKTSGRLAKVTARKGRIGELAGLAAGDRTVSYQTSQGTKEASVQDICRNAPVVTWAGVIDEDDAPVYHYGKSPSSVQVNQDLPPSYLQKTECALRGYTIDKSTAASLVLPIQPKEFDLDLVEQLKQQLAAAETRVSELEQTVEEIDKQQYPLRQELITAQNRVSELEQARTVSGDAKSTTPPRSNADPRVFKPLASPPPPVLSVTPKPLSPKQPNVPSSSTTTTSSALTGSL